MAATIEVFGRVATLRDDREWESADALILEAVRDAAQYFRLAPEMGDPISAQAQYVANSLGARLTR